MEETDHILLCSFCRVRLYLITPDFNRLFFVPPDITRENLIFAPYWRFRGILFSCQPYRVKHRVIDTSILAIKSPVLPATLGLRAQALKLQFINPGIKAHFLKQQVSFKNVFKHIENQGKTVTATSGKIFAFYREFIGETISLIYAPFFRKDNMLYDAIINSPVRTLSRESIEPLLVSERNDNWNMTFVPTLCPHCGWDLKGEKHSCVLFCTNCNSAWEADQNGFKRLDYGIIAAKIKEVLYIPFWMMKVEVEGVRLDSYADLIRFVNFPKAIQKDWEDREFYFWSPAFKVPPKLFLRLAKQMTIFQPAEKRSEILDGLSLYPVNLSAEEATETIVVTIAHITTDKKKVYPILPELKITLQEHFLIYVPFTVRANELVQCQFNFSINRNALKTGSHI